MIEIAKRTTDSERIARYKALKLTEQEEKELLAYDKAIDSAKKGERLEYDLPLEDEKAAKKYVRTGTRKTTAYKFNQKERKPDTVKEEMIAALANFLQKAGCYEKVTIVNKTQKISFTVDGVDFSYTLTRHNKKKGEG